MTSSGLDKSSVSISYKQFSIWLVALLISFCGAFIGYVINHQDHEISLLTENVANLTKSVEHIVAVQDTWVDIQQNLAQLTKEKNIEHEQIKERLARLEALVKHP